MTFIECFAKATYILTGYDVCNQAGIVCSRTKEIADYV